MAMAQVGNRCDFHWRRRLVRHLPPILPRRMRQGFVYGPRRRCLGGVATRRGDLEEYQTAKLGTGFVVGLSRMLRRTGPRLCRFEYFVQSW